LRDFEGGAAPRFPLQLDESLPLPADERTVWERRLNRHRRSCGCTEGAVGLCAGIAAACLGYLLRGRLGLAFLSVPILIGLPFGFLIAGKLIGLRLGRVRFTRACKQLLSRVTVTA
jgi:hypothetical protein